SGRHPTSTTGRARRTSLTSVLVRRRAGRIDVARGRAGVRRRGGVGRGRRRRMLVRLFGVLMVRVSVPVVLGLPVMMVALGALVELVLQDLAGDAGRMF